MARLGSQCSARSLGRMCLNHGHTQEDLPLVRDLPSSSPARALTLTPDLISTLPASSTRLALALPLVFFSFLQTRQATKVLNPTRVPRASPPATMMPSSGTSTRVARSPAGGPLVSSKQA